VREFTGVLVGPDGLKESFRPGFVFGREGSVPAIEEVELTESDVSDDDASREVRMNHLNGTSVTPSFGGFDTVNCLNHLPFVLRKVRNSQYTIAFNPRIQNPRGVDCL
jgi:hypothetical protein